ncbi:MAG: hypothetical protein AAFN50_06860 [Pseudomonadota bacterium]
MGKNILAGIVGVVLAGSIIMIVEMVGHTMFPPPPDLDFSDVDAMRSYVSTLPAGAFLSVVLAWTLGAFGGTLVASKIGNARALIFACIIGGLILAGTAYNLVTIPHPLWVAIVGIAGIVGGAWFGMRLGSAKAAPSE